MEGVEAKQGRPAIFWALAFSLFLLTRYPVFHQYLSIDNVNLAFALEKFDPRIHQPQPPGYPLFVVFSRIVNLVFRNPEMTFAMIALGSGMLCLPLISALGRRMFAAEAGQAAAILLLVAPPFWYSTIEGPLRPWLAVFSLLTAYCSWRCWNGEPQFMWWGALALGIGSGFRPDLGGYLFPLWLAAAWFGTRSITRVVQGCLLLAVIVGAWLAGMAYAVGGFSALYQLNREYVIAQSSRQSVVLGAAEREWLRQISRLVIWNGTVIVGWVWMAPLLSGPDLRLKSWFRPALFAAIWLLPGVLFQALVHVEDPGHTLFSTPVFCVLGGYVIWAAAPRISRQVALCVPVLVSALLFLGFFALPDAGEPAGGWRSLRNTFLFGVFETSIGELRYQNEYAVATLKELRQFTPAGRPLVVVSSDADYQNWFMNWRILRYYAPEVNIWVADDQHSPPLAQHVRGSRMLQANSGAVARIPVPLGGRVIWLLEREGPFHQALKSVEKPLPGGAYLSYSDIENKEPFRVMNFEFVPVEESPGAEH